MPLPSNQLQQIDQLIDKAFEEKGIVSKKDRASKALDSHGLSVEELVFHLANLILTAKDSVKRNALLDAFALHGISLKPEDQGTQVPNIIFQISGENVNLNQLFAPQRNFDSNTEAR